MRFCSACGAELNRVVPSGDDRERFVCPECATIHYQNPKTVVGCIVERKGELLLCRRAIEPAHGRWTFPAGFQELGETTLEGALRETREEADVDVEVLGPFAHLEIPHISQSYLVYRTRLLRGSVQPTVESSEVRFFPAGEIPWDDLAFPTIRFALQLYLEDRRLGKARMHFGTVFWKRRGGRYDFAQYELRDYRTIP